MRETVRQIIHLVFGLCIAGLVAFLDHRSVTVLIAAGLLSGVVLIELILRGYTLPLVSPLVAYVDRSDPLPGKGALCFVVSALACITIFPALLVVPALVTISVLDSMTTLVGTRYGRHRIHNGKSAEGTVGGVVVTAAALLPLLTAAGALVVAAVAGIIELLCPVDDNLVIPVIVCGILSVIPALV
jgi:dolichol kinase